jgi:hypothetical protein
MTPAEEAHCITFWNAGMEMAEIAVRLGSSARSMREL